VACPRRSATTLGCTPGRGEGSPPCVGDRGSGSRGGRRAGRGGPSPPEPRWRPGGTRGSGDHPVARQPAIPGHQPGRDLGRRAPAQGDEGCRGEADLPARPGRLRLPSHQPGVGHPLQRARHRQGPASHVRVPPPQGQQLALTHPRGDRQERQGAALRVLSWSGPAPVDVVRAEDLRVGSSHPGRGRQAGDVPRHASLANCGPGRALQHPVDVVDGGGARPGRQPLGVAGLQLGGLEAAQPEPAHGGDEVTATQLPVPSPGAGPQGRPDPGPPALSPRDHRVPTAGHRRPRCPGAGGPPSAAGPPPPGRGRRPAGGDRRSR